MTFYEKFSHKLTLEVQIVWFSVLMLQMEVSKCWKIVEFEKISIKMKNCKEIYEAKRASCLKEIIQPPPTPNPPPVRKIFLRRYTEIYRHLLSKCFKNAVLGRQEMVQRKCFY